MSVHEEHAIVRRALSSQLEARGCSVAADTGRAKGELYIWGEGDRAAALFEFKPTADEAYLTMYQGSWLPTLPPRFAVLPTSEKNALAIEMLHQVGLSVLFYELADGGVRFVDLEAAMALIAQRSSKLD
jgi:hypothetical protein